MRPRHASLGGVIVDLLDEQEVLTAYERALTCESRPVAIESANLDHLHWFPKGSHDRSTDVGFDWLTLMDGAPLVYMARKLTGHELPRLTGADLLLPMLEIASRNGKSFGVFGGGSEMHERLGAVLEQRLPSLEVAGMWSPSRRSLSDPVLAGEWVDTIRESDVDVLVVALGKPRQEEWIRQHGRSTGAQALLAFGAATDYLAGTVKRAPSFYQQHGLEWAYRLVHEPRRLARRYVIEGPPSLVKLIRHSQTREP